jgi:hypothetical protein
MTLFHVGEVTGTNQGRQCTEKKRETHGICFMLEGTVLKVILDSPVVSVLATGPKVCEFKLGQGQWIF